MKSTHDAKSPDSETSLSQELRQMMQRQLKLFFKWMGLAPEKPLWLELLKYLYKIPALALLVLLSPVAFIVLIFTFIIIL